MNLIAAAKAATKPRVPDHDVPAWVNPKDGSGVGQTVGAGLVGEAVNASGPVWLSVTVATALEPRGVRLEGGADRGRVAANRQARDRGRLKAYADSCHCYVPIGIFAAWPANDREIKVCEESEVAIAYH